MSNWDDISATLEELDGDSSNIIDLIQRSYDVSETVLALIYMYQFACEFCDVTNYCERFIPAYS